MTTLREAAQQALAAMEAADVDPHSSDAVYKAIEALRAALAEPVQEPVAKVELMTTGGNAGLATRIVEIDDHLRERLRPGQLLYAAPPQRKPLTEVEIVRIFETPELAGTHFQSPTLKAIAIARAIERAHGIGETK